MVRINYDDFIVGYFPPIDKFYISNGKDMYLTGGGNKGPVYYYDSFEEAEEALKKFKNKKGEN